MQSRSRRNADPTTGAPAPAPAWLGLLPPTIRVLCHRNFALYWASQLLSCTGTWMQNLAAVWLLLQLTGSAFLVGINGLFLSIPVLTLSYLGGVVADRVNCRKLLIATQSARLGGTIRAGPTC